MKLTEYIAILQAQLLEHGDLDVEKTYAEGFRGEATGSAVTYRKITKENQKTAFWNEYIDKPATKGSKVIRLG